MLVRIVRQVDASRLIIVAAGRPDAIAELGPESDSGFVSTINLQADLDDATIVQLLQLHGIAGSDAEVVLQAMRQRPGGRSPAQILQMAELYSRSSGQVPASPPA